MLEEYFDPGKNKKYKIKAIGDNTMYASKIKSQQLGFFQVIA